MRLEGKVAVVTGAGSGMGRAMAKRFVEEGASVVAADRHADAACEAAKEIGGRIVAFTANVATEAEATAMVEKAVSAFGRIDILVNNAGVMDLFQSVADVNNDTWRRDMSVNVDGPMFAMRKAVPLMLAQGSGVIVNIASVAGLGGGLAAPPTPPPSTRLSASREARRSSTQRRASGATPSRREVSRPTSCSRSIRRRSIRPPYSGSAPITPSIPACCSQSISPTSPCSLPPMRLVTSTARSFRPTWAGAQRNGTMRR